MKLIKTLIFLLVISQNGLFAQCLNDNHSTNSNDSWQSCQLSQNPNPARANSHWMMLDLGHIYKLTTTKFWNYNVSAETGKGFKDTFIDVSEDGINWTEVADFQVPEATGAPTYTGYVGPDLGGVKARYIIITAQNVWDNGNCAGLSDVRFDVEMGVSISAKVFLEGNFDGTGNMMTDDLRSMDLIPELEPFSPLGYTHVNGGGYEYLDLPALTTTGNDAIVDWLLLELRDKDDATNILASKTVLLQRDGDVVATDGVSIVEFPNVIADDYFISLKHRNHIGIRTATTYSLSNIMISIDFTNDPAIIEGTTNGIQDLGNGIYGLFSGDSDYNNQVQNTDKVETTIELGKAGYLQSDIDLNGQVQNTDIQLKLTPNLGKGAQYN